MIFFKEKEEILLPITEHKPNDSNEVALPIVDLSVEQEQTIIVDVKGAVYNPGVYELPERSRVHEAITAAGGTVQEADVTKVNLAAFIKDGQIVYVPHTGEEASILGDPLSTVNAGGQTSDNLININFAGLDELQKLPGIGPSKAQAIVIYREEHGSFKDTKDLMKVSGIGQKTLEKLLPLITVK